MKEYEVEVVATATVRAYYTVEANSKEEAEEKVDEIRCNSDFSVDDCLDMEIIAQEIG